jgi:hypothetical protein
MNTTTLAQSDLDDGPWYRQRWAWLLMVMPVTAIFTGSITMYLAITTFDGLVADDYYKEGLAINATMARAVVARDMGLSAQVNITAEQLALQLAARPGMQLPAKVHVTLSHPTRGGLDQTLLLEGHDGHYQAHIQPLTSAHWKVLIEDESRSWKLTGNAFLPTETEIRIDSADLKPVD